MKLGKVRVTEISLVDKPATRRKFILYKAEEVESMAKKKKEPSLEELRTKLESAALTDEEREELESAIAELEAKADKCPECGVELKDGECPDCGYKAPKKGKESGDQDKEKLGDVEKKVLGEVVGKLDAVIDALKKLAESPKYGYPYRAPKKGDKEDEENKEPEYIVVSLTELKSAIEKDVKEGIKSEVDEAYNRGKTEGRDEAQKEFESDIEQFKKDIKALKENSVALDTLREILSGKDNK